MCHGMKRIRCYYTRILRHISPFTLSPVIVAILDNCVSTENASRQTNVLLVQKLMGEAIAFVILHPVGVRFDGHWSEIFFYLLVTEGSNYLMHYLIGTNIYLRVFSGIVVIHKLIRYLFQILSCRPASTKSNPVCLESSRF